MQIKELSSGKEPLWDSYVARHPGATFFHRSGWKKVIERSTGHQGHYLMASDNDHVAGVYPLFILSTGLFGTMGVSLPYVNYGGILADSVEIERLLIETAETVGRDAGCRYIELRQRFPMRYETPSSNHKVASVISLCGDAEETFKRLHQNVRNKIRKAQKNGVIVQNGAEHLGDFYRVYSRNLRDLGTPVITQRFFECIAETFPEHVRVYRATRQGKTIGAKVVFMDSKTCYFEFSASVRESLCHAPVHAMNWAAIETASAAGCRQVDLGRSTAESAHCNFKKYWGSETHNLSVAYQLLNCDQLPGLNKENPKFSLAIALWKRLPLFISRLLGPPIARCLP
ncbi:MAG: FemAB family PEP-CTERM system-associated protein [Nitrospirae bacterium]|nr:FemAB family PEP-CTERM system-associated protein [Nitrospirota bacterium]